jgi:hypothetical protein
VQLGGVGRHARHEVAVEGRHRHEPAVRGEIEHVLARLLEVAAVHDYLGSPGRHRGVLVRAVAFGTTTVTGTECTRPVNAMDWPWLPRFAVINPRTGPLASKRHPETNPPRTLNAPVGVAFSRLTQVRQPFAASSSGHR